MEFWELKAATTVMAYVFALAFLGLFWVIIWKIFTDRIDIRTIIAEESGKSSMSRFQLLLFTLSIAGLYVLLSIENGQLIDVPNGALGLLGISGGSFLISKGMTPKAPAPIEDVNTKTVITEVKNTSTLGG